jgi:acetyltransferase-like isoleucine patch superfamily enzyme
MSGRTISEIVTIAGLLAGIKWRHLKRRLGIREPDLHVAVGRHTYGVVPGVTVTRPTADAPVTIGSFCSISAGVQIIAHAEHPLDLPSTYPFRTLMFGGLSSFGGLRNRDAVTRGPVIIGHDVWIGQNAVVLSGVTVGTGAVIGAGSVVAKDVAPYSVVAGNPARLVRTRFPDATIARLLTSRWWELSDALIETLDRELYSTDIDGFLMAVERARISQ